MKVDPIFGLVLAQWTWISLLVFLERMTRPPKAD